LAFFALFLNFSHKFKTNKTLDLGKLGELFHNFKQVRIIPKHMKFRVELIVSITTEVAIKTPNNRYMALDLGVNNLIVAVTNTGSRPVISSGKEVKSTNQFYNKAKAHYTSILRQGKNNHGSVAVYLKMLV